MQEAHFHRRLTSLLSESRLDGLERFDDTDSSTILQRVVPDFADLLRRGRDLLSEIEQTCSSTEIPADFWALPDRVEELENLCFFVDGEWKRSIEGLERLTESTPGWNCLVQVECARDRLVRGLTAVEREYAAVAGSESRTGHLDLLRDALQVRRALTEFRWEVANLDARQAADLDQRLRGAGSALARLTEREEYTRLRAADRHLARDLLRRIEGWLGGGDPAGESGGAEGLWQDVVNFAALLWDINRRDELVEEDLAVIGDAVGELEAQALRGPLPNGVTDRLRTLFGRDDRLDELVAQQADAQEILDRLLAIKGSLTRDRVPEPA
jgi:hypothetical protein